MSSTSRHEAINAVLAAAEGAPSVCQRVCGIVSNLLLKHEAVLLDVSHIAEMLELTLTEVVRQDTFKLLTAPLSQMGLHEIRSAWPKTVFTASFAGSTFVWVVGEDIFDEQSSALLHPATSALRVQHGHVSLWLNPLVATVDPPVVELPDTLALFPLTVAAMCLLAAKNSKVAQHSVPRAIRRRKGSQPRVVFSVIQVDMGRPKARSAPRGLEAFPSTVPWHRRRGHFKFYYADKPMFGVLGQDGWYWVDHTEVGSKEHGEIHKDYVLAPSVPAQYGNDAYTGSGLRRSAR